MFRTAYDGKQKEFSIATGLACVGPSKTKQSEKDSCDVNKILAKFMRTGLLKHVEAHNGMYADLTGVPTFQEAMNIVARGNEAFASLPSKIRKRFENDPAQFLEFVGDPANKDEMIALGLMEKPTPPVSTPDPVQPVGGAS